MLEATQNSKQSLTQERHILVIDDHECGVFALDAATYSVGRDASNAIVLNDESVSRRHALLLRMPIPEENRYRYRLIDGNSLGQSSTNGTIVNGTPCQSHELAKGDSIQFGKNSFCTYLIISGEEAEMNNYLASAEFQSIKSGVVNPKATITAPADQNNQNTDIWLEDPIEPEQEDATIIFSKHSAYKKEASDAEKSKIATANSQSWGQHIWKIALGVGVGTIIAIAGFWHMNNQSDPTPSESSVNTSQS